MSPGQTSTDLRRRAGWLPNGQEDLEAWLADHQTRTDAAGEHPLHPTVVALQELLEGDPVLRMYAERMLEEVPPGKAYSKRLVRDVPQLLRLIDSVLTRAPEFSSDSLVMTPLLAVLDWAMGRLRASPPSATRGSTPR